MAAEQVTREPIPSVDALLIKVEALRADNAALTEERDRLRTERDETRLQNSKLLTALANREQAEAALQRLRDENKTLEQAVTQGAREIRRLEKAWVETKSEATDWILVADGVKHDWRCVFGEANTDLCLRCRLAAAEQRIDDEIERPKREMRQGLPPIEDMIAADRERGHITYVKCFQCGANCQAKFCSSECAAKFGEPSALPAPREERS